MPAIFISFSLVLLTPLPVITAQVASDAHSLSVIFDEQHVLGSALSVRSSSRRLDAAERYEFLSDWVLPGETHPNFRLGLAFAPTDPAPPTRKQYGIGSADLSTSFIGDAVTDRGGYPISPAFDLMAIARKLGKLEEVRRRIVAAPAAGEHPERCRLALLVLTDIALEDFPSAITNLDELSVRLREKTFEDYRKRWPETLAAWAGVQPVTTRKAARDLLFSMLHNQVRIGHACGPAAWDRSITALGGLLTYDQARPGNSARESLVSALPFELAHFSPLSRTTALTRGNGFPGTRWIATAGHIEKIAGHNDDYLMYHLPLRGEFDVECDVSHFGWSDCHLSVAGVWVAPTDEPETVDLGEFRQARPSLKLDPPLSLYDEFIHYRVEVRDRTSVTYLNGRPVHRETLPEQHAPWIAIRSPWNANSVVRGLRITGTPHIPEKVSLSVLPDLKGWTAYYDESVGFAGADWRFENDSQGNGEIVGRRRTELAGSSQESLLRYQRPMFEDGTIEYEFFYSEGASLVHPALDRRTFLLAEKGVRLHWITDGIYDSAGRDPADSIVEPECRRGEGSLPLLQQRWNRVTLSLKGDTVDLMLNGQQIYRCDLEPVNRRTFGLFHYSDRSEARVRNIVWSGEWPRELPPVSDQRHADHSLQFLDDDLADLDAHYEHDFTQADFPSPEFIVRGEDWQEHVNPTPRGLQVETRFSEAFRPTYLSPRLIVEGDFDIVAEFADLQTDVAEDGASGIFLRTILEDEYEQRTVFRGLVQHPPAPARQLMEAIVVDRDGDSQKMTYRGVTSEEAAGGRLRVARRGKTVYCLFAEGDSSLFRLVYSGPYDDQPLRREGVRLMTAVQGTSGAASVIWKHLTIRAERIIR